MNVLVASDAHKGFASSIRVGKWIKSGIMTAKPEWNVHVISIGDGGEGTVDSLVLAKKGKYRSIQATNPLGRPITVRIGVAPSVDVAFLEVSGTAGATKLNGEEWNTLYTSSFGVGAMLRSALQIGLRNIVIGLGGSIISDGGLGMAQALGAQFFDYLNKPVQPKNGQYLSCQDLINVDKVNITEVSSFITDKRFTILSDVDIPLLGPYGQAHTFGAQKKAGKQDIEFIECALTNWNRVLYDTFDRDFDAPLAGAAGGLGAGLQAFLSGDLRLGIDYVLDAIGFDDLCKNYDVVVTGEGCLDRTTELGKSCLGIARRCQNLGKPYYGIFGCIKEMINEFTHCSIDASLRELNSDETSTFFSEKSIIEASRRLCGEIERKK